MKLDIVNKSRDSSVSNPHEISFSSDNLIHSKEVQDNYILQQDLQRSNDNLRTHGNKSSARNANDKSATAQFTEKTTPLQQTEVINVEDMDKVNALPRAFHTERNSPRDTPISKPTLPSKLMQSLNPQPINSVNNSMQRKSPERGQQKTEFTGPEKDKLIEAQRAKERYELEYQKNLDALKDINMNPSIPKMTTFDQRTVEVVPKVTDENKYSGLQFFPQKFNFEQFEFFQQESNEWKLAEYQKQFIIAENCKENQQKIFNQLVEMAFIQASEQIDKSEELKDIPKLFNENKKQFFKMLVKSHKMQRFFQQFNDHFQVIMKKEILKNYKGMNLYLRHPRKAGRSLSPTQLYPSLHEVKRDILKEEKYIQQSLDTAREKFNYTKQRKEQRDKQLNKHKEKSKLKFKNQIFEEEKKEEPTKTSKDVMALGVVNKWKKHSKAKPKIYSDFQMALMESTSRVDKMIAEIDDNNIDVLNEVRDTHDALQKLEEESKKNNLTAFPGAKIANMMEKWGKEEVYSSAENKQFSTELWISLEEFEKQLKDEIKGHTIMHKAMVKEYEEKIKRLKNFTSFRIEALESALIKTKMRANAEREQLMMQIEEQESVKFNTQNKAGQIDSFIKKIEGPMVFKNVVEARVVIDQLTKSLKINREHTKINEEKVKNLSFVLDQTNAKIKQVMDQKETQDDLRKYYQTLILKLVRDLEIYKDDEEHGEKFEMIDELNPDLEQQKKIMQSLKEINLQYHLITHANKFFGQAESLEKLQEQISEMRTQRNAFGGSASPTKGLSMRSVVSQVMKSNRNKKQSSKKILINPIQSGEETPRSGIATPSSQAGTRGGFSIFQKEKLMGLIKQGIEGYLEVPKATTTSGLPDPPEVIEAKKAKKAKKAVKKKKAEVKVQSSQKREKSKFSGNQQSLEETFEKDLKEGLPTIESKGLTKSDSNQNSTENIANIEINEESVSQASISLETPIVKERIQNVEFQNVEQATKKLNILNVKENNSPKKQISPKKSPERKQSLMDQPSKSPQKSPEKKQATKIDKKPSMILKKPEPQSKSNPGSAQKTNVQNKLKQATKNLYNEAQKKTQQGAKGGLKSPQKERNEGNVDAQSAESSIDRNTLRLASQLQIGSGICAIDRELDDMVMPQYIQLTKRVEEKLKDDSKRFNFEAKQIQEVQNVVQASLGKKLDFDDNQSLFNSDIDIIMKSFQTIIEKQFGFESINQIIMKGQEVPDDASPIKRQSVNFGDILKPVISQTGEFLGLQLRPQLAKSMILSNNFELTHIKKIMKICLFVNRLIKDGMEDDFHMKQVKPGQDRKPKEMEIQVDVEELQANVEIKHEDRETPEEINVHEKALLMLKNHAIDILTRMNPDKKGYYKMVWEDMDLEKLFDYKLSEVFKDQEGERTDRLGEGLSFAEYLQQLFQSVNTKLHEIGLNQDQKKRLIVDDFISMGKKPKTPEPQPIQVVIEVDKFEESCQATVPQYDACVMTGEELMPQPTIIREESPPKAPLTRAQRIQMKGKNQLILDKAMEEELVKTLNLFDSYVTEMVKSEKIQDIADKAAKKYEKQKDQIEVQKYFSNMETTKKKFRQDFDVDIRVNNMSPKFFSGSNSGSGDDTDYEYDLSKIRNKLMNQIQNLKQDTQQKKAILFPLRYDDMGSARFPKTTQGSIAGVTGFQSSMRSDANNYNTQAYGSRENTQGDSQSNSPIDKDLHSKFFRQNMTAHLDFSPRKKDNVIGGALKAGKKSLMVKAQNKKNLPSISFDQSSHQNVPSILMANVTRNENLDYQRKQNVRHSQDLRVSNNYSKTSNKIKLQTLNQDIKYQENTFFGPKTKPQSKAINSLVSSPANVPTALTNQSSSRFRRAANKTQMPKLRPNKDGENAFQEFIRYKQNQTSQKYNEETQTNDKSNSIHLDLNASLKKESHFENDLGSQADSLKYVSDTDQSTHKKVNTMASIPSQLIDQVVSPGKNFKWHNKNAEQNWINAQKMTGRTHKKNIVSQSIDVKNFQQKQRTGNLSTVEPKRDKIVAPVAINQQSGPRFMPLMSSLQSIGGVSLMKSKESQQDSSLIANNQKVSHNIDVAINEETSSQAITRFQIYPPDTRNIRDLEYLDSVNGTLPMQKTVVKRDKTLNQNSPHLTTNQSQMFEPMQIGNKPMFVPRFEGQSNSNNY